MKTRWDVLFKLFELKGSRLIHLSKKLNSSSSSTRNHLKKLVTLGMVQHVGHIYSLNKKHPKTWHAFKIMQFCKNKCINPNLFFSKNIAKILVVVSSKDEVKLSDFKCLNSKTVRKYLTYLSRLNLIFIISKKPLTIKRIRNIIVQK